MQKTFFSNLVLLLILNLLVKPIWILGVEVGVQRALGPEAYGDYFILFNFSFLFMVLMDFGLNNYNNRQVSRNPLIMPEQLVSIGLVKLGLGLLVLLLIQLVAYFMGFDLEKRNLLWGVSLVLYLQSVLLFIRSNLSGIQWYRADVMISVLDRTISILLVGSMLWIGIEGYSLTIERFVWAQVLAYVIAISVALILLLSRAKNLKVRVDWSRIGRMMRSSFFYALLLFLMSSYYRIDAIMIDRFLEDGELQAGLYAQGFKLLEAGYMMAYLFSTLLMPMFSRMIKKKENLAPLVGLASQLLLIPTTIGAIGAAFYRQEIMDLLYTTGTTTSAGAFLFLTLSLIPIAVTYVFGTLITAKGDLRKLNIIATLGLVVNVIGNWILIPRIGIVGAAIVTLSTQTVVAIAQVIVAYRMFEIKVESKDLKRVIVFSLGILALGLVAKDLIGTWQLELVAFILLSMVLAIALRLFSFVKLIELVRLRETETD